MRKNLLTAILSLGTALSASSAIITADWNTGFSNGGNIPDGTASPWSDTRTISGGVGTITDVALRLTINGGYNGDLYAYLSYNSVLVPLMNRVGVGTGNDFGYSDSGLSVKFTDSAANNIHFYQSVGGWSILGGATWKPDGRTNNPVTSPSSDFDADGTVSLNALSVFNPNGDWSLVIADVSVGGGQATLASWGMDITTTDVPEPSTVLQSAVVAGAALLALRRRLQARRN